MWISDLMLKALCASHYVKGNKCVKVLCLYAFLCVKEASDVSIKHTQSVDLRPFLICSTWTGLKYRVCHVTTCCPDSIMMFL